MRGKFDPAIFYRYNHLGPIMAGEGWWLGWRKSSFMMTRILSVR